VEHEREKSATTTYSVKIAEKEDSKNKIKSKKE